MSSYSSQKNAGFTLVELLVVIAIIGIISALAFGNVNSYHGTSYMQSATNQVIGLSKQIRQDSISVKEFNGEFPSYGLKFEVGNKIKVYADCVANETGGVIDQDDNFTDQVNCSSGPDSLKPVILDYGVTISAVELVPVCGEQYGVTNRIDNASPSDTAYLEYLRPNPFVFISAGDGTVMPTGSLDVTLTTADGKISKVVEFNTVGLIQVKNNVTTCL